MRLPEGAAHGGPMITSNTPPEAGDRLVGNPAELYERHFVPRIGAPIAEILNDAAHLVGGERVLDVACGTGVVARIASDRVGRSGSVVGIDGHPGMLDVARSASDAPIGWQQADAHALPFDPSSFDVALCSMGLQFFDRPDVALAEMHRVIAPDGRLVACVPGPTPPPMRHLHDSLVDHVGPDAAAFVERVFALGDQAQLRTMCRAATSADPRLSSHQLELRLDPPAEFLWQYLLSTPLADLMRGLDPRRLSSLEDEMVQRWRPFETAGGMTMSVDVHVLTAQGAQT